MITDRGIGGPAVLSLSLAVTPALAENKDVLLRMDLRPEKTLDHVLARQSRPAGMPTGSWCMCRGSCRGAWFLN